MTTKLDKFTSFWGCQFLKQENEENEDKGDGESLDLGPLNLGPIWGGGPRGALNRGAYEGAHSHIQRQSRKFLGGRTCFKKKIDFPMKPPFIFYLLFIEN